MNKIFLRALLVGILPPIWACLATYTHIQTGAVALICAGLVLIKSETPLAVFLGLLVGDIWGYVSLSVIQLVSPNFQLLAQF